MNAFPEIYMNPIDPVSRISMLETMMLIRQHEEGLALLHATGAAPGTCTAVGQEASAVGVVQALGPHDLLLTNHRSAGHLLARGADPGRVAAEALGRSSGYCGGRSGSLHISARELGVVLTSTIVGGELSLAPGVALAQKMLRRTGIVTCFFGDGAASEGIFHEALNLATTWRLPLLFVCENNEWQAFVHRRETMTVDRISTWAERYGLPCEAVDGNDVEAVHAAARRAVDGVRRHGGPAFLETLTYRMRGHFEPDDQSYVDPQELAAWRGRDPIERQRQRLLSEQVLGRGELAHIEQRVRASVEAALAFAQAAPFPDAGEIASNVYA